MGSGTRLIPITARAVPDHKRVEIIMSQRAQAEVALRSLFMWPDEVRRLARKLLRAADEAEMPTAGRRRGARHG